MYLFVRKSIEFKIPKTRLKFNRTDAIGIIIYKIIYTSRDYLKITKFVLSM